MNRIIKETPIYYLFLSCIEKNKVLKEYNKWKKNGMKVPMPHLLKQKTLLEYSIRYKLKVLVETGTYTGKMVEAMRRNFDKIYSIELNQILYEKASKRFTNKKNVEIISGNSGKELGQLLKQVNQPALFWLDGHFSGGNTSKGIKDTPVIEELECILTAPDFGHVVLIDDACYFGINPDYPSFEELKRLIILKRQGLNIEVKNDIIRITP